MAYVLYRALLLEDRLFWASNRRGLPARSRAAQSSLYSLSNGCRSISGRIVTGTPSGEVPFQANIDLLRLFLTQRPEIVESIEAVLNAQRKPIQYLQDRALLSRRFEECFLTRTGVTDSQTRFRDQLEEAHWAGGFRPRPVQDLHNDLIDPAEMMVRGFYCWQQTRWPGRNGRMHYAHTLFNLYVIRWLEFLSMRIWDEDPSSARGRLVQIQGVLDELWRSSPAGQPVIVRDARWLIPLAQSPITDELAPYFEVARQVTETLPEADVVAIEKAHVRMLGGHLTSQIRYYCTRDGVSMDEHSVVNRTRTSNALDFALLVQGLVVLLKGYGCALQSSDKRIRLDMAGAIWQGISADPELFLNRVDLLGAYSMIEHVFITTDREDHAAYSQLGQRHVRLLREYGALVDRLIEPLRDDLPCFRPAEGGFSPYGVIFGLPSHLIEHMALKSLQHDAETRFSLEDVFDDGDASAAKLEWVNGWRRLAHIDRETQRLYDYPQQFAEEVYDRIGRELRRRDLDAGARESSKIGHLYIVCGNDLVIDSKGAAIPELPARYFASSDPQMVAAQKAEPYEQAQLLAGRREGHFLVSYETPGGWMALKKDLLTDVLGVGGDARIVGLPLEAAQVLRLMCTDLTRPEHGGDEASVAGSREKTGPVTATGAPESGRE
ncbi:MAG: hypothetical protein JO323_13075 [Acidobacteriia bacterium]|nr:hypothetical protein [Terriglobia bacterium]